MRKPLTIFSTFSGIGGFEVGIRNAALSVWHGETAERDGKTATSQPGMESTEASLFSDGDIPYHLGSGKSGEISFVGYSEIDKYAISVYEKHFGGTKNYGDITKINWEEVPNFDCLVGGFPCQAFSIAGKRLGFDEVRGTLFFELAKALKEKQPRLFVFENVKGLLSHDEGRTFRVIITTLDELGYDLQWQVFNSKDFGVPQNRERVFIVGHLRGTPRPEVFPIIRESNENTTLEKSTKTEIARTLTGGGHSGGNHSGMTIIGTLRTHNDGKGFRENKSGICPTIPARARADGSGQPVIFKTVRSSGRGSPHGSKQNWDSYIIQGNIRRLTPLECERLQSFPDDWTKYGINERGETINISDTQRYKMCGNAVTTKVIQAVFERILEKEEIKNEKD